MGLVKSKPFNTDVQIWAMRSRYPNFRVKRKSELEIEFTGELHVKPELPTYKVSITYRGSLSPMVKVISPDLVPDPPHFYKESKTLCLYHPENFKWAKEKLIANEIVAWTATWIYFYEVWLQTGIWYGPEASHDTIKSQL
jgi:hypothetical protein